MLTLYCVVVICFIHFFLLVGGPFGGLEREVHCRTPLRRRSLLFVWLSVWWYCSWLSFHSNL